MVSNFESNSEWISIRSLSFLLASLLLATFNSTINCFHSSGLMVLNTGHMNALSGSSPSFNVGKYYMSSGTSCINSQIGSLSSPCTLARGAWSHLLDVSTSIWQSYSLKLNKSIVFFYLRFL